MTLPKTTPLETTPLETTPPQTTPPQTTPLETLLPETLPPKTLRGRIAALFRTPDPGRFETAEVGQLDLALSGIAGDRHDGFVRASGGREPWYPRGTKIRNDRQLSVLSAEELAEIAGRLDLPSLDPAWIGGNLVLEGVPRLSFLPSGTRLVFAGGAVVHIEAPNAPCRIAGRAIARANPGRDDLELAFPREAKRLRGVIASVERAGTIETGEAVTVKVPEQWIYAG